MDVTWLPDAEPRPRHVAVGEFDGVHLGHREVIRGSDTVLTFEPHPRFVVAPQAAPKLITTLEEALDFLPAVTLAGEDARKAGHGVAVAGPEGSPSTAAVRLLDADGLIALAEPREDGLLKPVVGFRG